MNVRFRPEADLRKDVETTQGKLDRMNLRLFRKAFMFMVTTLLIIFTVGLIFWRQSWMDAAFNPIVSAAAFVAGFVYYRQRGVE